MPQSHARIYEHATFSTKNREPWLAEAWRDEIFNVLGGSANNIGCHSIIVSGVADHVHLLFALGRTLSIADAVTGIKVPFIGWVNETRGLDSPFHWQAGKGAFSASQSNVELVREYIRRQSEHHATQSFQDEFRKLMRSHGIEWDGRYVWD